MIILLEENISEQNAFMRLVCGVTITSYGIARLSKKPGCMMAQGMIICGALKIAEGIYQYCPLKNLMTEMKETDDSEEYV